MSWWPKAAGHLCCMPVHHFFHHVSRVAIKERWNGFLKKSSDIFPAVTPVHVQESPAPLAPLLTRHRHVAQRVRGHAALYTNNCIRSHNTNALRHHNWDGQLCPQSICGHWGSWFIIHRRNQTSRERERDNPRLGLGGGGAKMNQPLFIMQCIAGSETQAAEHWMLCDFLRSVSVGY